MTIRRKHRHIHWNHWSLKVTTTEGELGGIYVAKGIRSETICENKVAL